MNLLPSIRRFFIFLLATLKHEVPVGTSRVSCISSSWPPLLPQALTTKQYTTTLFALSVALLVVVMTSTPAIPYCYQPLDGPKWIRLLKLDLSQGSSESEIRCALEHHKLVPGKFLPYACLSYTWGEPSPKHPITINGNELLITPQLRDALLQLREYQRRGTVATDFWWIDAICINQADVQERGHQVQLMRAIYQWSKLTVAWLGPSDCETVEAFGAMRLGVRSEAASRLFERPYWQRLWVCASTRTVRDTLG